MLKIRVILILGLLTALMPYTGFPYTTRNVVISVLGLMFVYISLVMYKEHREDLRRKAFLMREQENGQGNFE